MCDWDGWIDEWIHQRPPMGILWMYNIGGRSPITHPPNLPPNKTLPQSQTQQQVYTGQAFTTPLQRLPPRFMVRAVEAVVRRLAPATQVREMDVDKM